MKKSLAVQVVAFWYFFAGASAEAIPRQAPTDNLVVDIRVFEARDANPDRALMSDLSFVIDTDGRAVTANQWLATVSKKVSGSFLAALASETVRVEEGSARVSWSLRSRSLDIALDLDGPDANGSIKARVETAFSRSGQPIRELQDGIELRLGQTTAWSREGLEIHLRDYLSHFRDYPDREHRGLIYERLRSRSIYLVLTATPRRLRQDELPQLSPIELEIPPGTELPVIDNQLGIPLQGTIIVGFELGPSWMPTNPQIVWSTIPEANPRILGEVGYWKFKDVVSPTTRTWGRVKISLQIP
jgi:hypothetical protein